MSADACTIQLFRVRAYFTHDKFYLKETYKAGISQMQGHYMYKLALVINRIKASEL